MRRADAGSTAAPPRRTASCRAAGIGGQSRLRTIPPAGRSREPGARHPPRNEPQFFVEQM